MQKKSRLKSIFKAGFGITLMALFCVGILLSVMSGEDYIISKVKQREWPASSKSARCRAKRDLTIHAEVFILVGLRNEYTNNHKQSNKSHSESER